LPTRNEVCIIEYSEVKMVVEESITKIKKAVDDDSIVVSCIPPPKYLLPFFREEQILFVHKMVRQIFTITSSIISLTNLINFQDEAKEISLMNTTKSSTDSDSDGTVLFSILCSL